MSSRRDTALSALSRTVDRAAAVARRQEQLVGQARHAGATWQQIADALAVTPQAAHKRYRDIRYDPASGRVWHEHPLPL